MPLEFEDLLKQGRQDKGTAFVRNATSETCNETRMKMNRNGGRFISSLSVMLFGLTRAGHKF